MRERGSALLTAVVAVMVLLLISGAFFSTIIYQSKLETSEEKALKAYYMAEAGINYEIAAVLNSRIAPSPPSLPQNTTVLVPSPFGATYGGQFNAQWLDDGNTYTFTVTSDGSYQGITRTLKEQYKYPSPPL